MKREDCNQIAKMLTLKIYSNLLATHAKQPNWHKQQKSSHDSKNANIKESSTAPRQLKQNNDLNHRQPKSKQTGKSADQQDLSDQTIKLNQDNPSDTTHKSPNNITTVRTRKSPQHYHSGTSHNKTNILL